MYDIQNYASFVRIEPIIKGWSNDQKFYVETAIGEKRLLRIADIALYDQKKQEFEIMKQLADSGVPMSQPVEIGVCNEGRSVYTLYTWCEGEEAESVLPKLPAALQLQLGLRAGQILRKIHKFSAPVDRQPWETFFLRKVDRKMQQYLDCGIKFEGDDHIIAYIEANRSLLSGRPQCFQHGDYHVGNMIVSPDGELMIIDFNRSDYGDPWEEFNRIVFSAAISPHFATGQIKGYFDGNPPEEFFKLLAFYISSNTLSAIPWAIPYGEQDVAVMLKQAKDVLAWFEEMKNPQPSWYLSDICLQSVDGVPFRLKGRYDFSFLRTYGEVFKVYDDQDSGNICFGIRDGEQRYFVKFAGAPTVRYPGQPEEAIERLKSAVKIYQELAHPNLVRLLRTEEIGGGFAAIFEWTDAVCLSKMFPESRERFLKLDDGTKLNVFLEIVDFHIHVAQRGYVAIDFYDGSIMYDFEAGKTVLYDIDHYARTPYTNTTGRMWASSRFMSPEEVTLGAAIDEITNVYLMGAVAFALFGAEKDRSREAWRLSDALYAVASKSVSDDRSKRHQSLVEFKQEWEAAIKSQK